MDSDEYFASRPLGSRVSASVSQQSRPISNRKELEERAAEFREKLEHRCERSLQPWDSIRESMKAGPQLACGAHAPHQCASMAVSIARWPAQETHVDSPPRSNRHDSERVPECGPLLCAAPRQYHRTGRTLTLHPFHPTPRHPSPDTSRCSRAVRRCVAHVARAQCRATRRAAEARILGWLSTLANEHRVLAVEA